MLHLRDAGPTEVGGFGITEADDLLFVNDLVLIEQYCTEVTVEFADNAVADFFENQIDLQRKPEQFARIWFHTHPGDSPQPSTTDVKTFDRVFGNCDWAVMFIIAQGGKTYAELYWRHGGPASLRMHVEVDYSQPFPSTDHLTWDAEYKNCVHDQSLIEHQQNRAWEDWDLESWNDYEQPADPFQNLAPNETDYESLHQHNHQETP